MNIRLATRSIQLSMMSCAALTLFAACSQAAWGSEATKPGSAAESVLAGSLPDAPAAAVVSGAASPKVPLEAQDHPRVKLFDLPLNMLRDGVHIAVSPAYLRGRDLKWLLPIAGATTVALNTDTKTMTEVVSSNPSFNHANVNVSDGLVYGFIAAPVAFYGVGLARGNERMHETGLLGGEAMADAYVVDTVIKLCTFRERPNVDHGRGNFYVGSAGVDSSFISGHSMIAWSSAAVMAGEFRSKWAQAGFYTLATGVSLTRVLGQQHFPSDVLLGATTGWLIGHYVFRAHHRVPMAGNGK